MTGLWSIALATATTSALLWLVGIIISALRLSPTVGWFTAVGLVRRERARLANECSIGIECFSLVALPSGYWASEYFSIVGNSYNFV